VSPERMRKWLCVNRQTLRPTGVQTIPIPSHTVEHSRDDAPWESLQLLIMTEERRAKTGASDHLNWSRSREQKPRLPVQSVRPTDPATSPRREAVRDHLLSAANVIADHERERDPSGQRLWES
jgi:hypothetical protein